MDGATRLAPPVTSHATTPNATTKPPSPARSLGRLGWSERPMATFFPRPDGERLRLLLLWWRRPTDYHAHLEGAEGARRLCWRAPQLGNR